MTTLLYNLGSIITDREVGYYSKRGFAREHDIKLLRPKNAAIEIDGEIWPIQSLAGCGVCSFDLASNFLTATLKDDINANVLVKYGEPINCTFEVLVIGFMARGKPRVAEWTEDGWNIVGHITYRCRGALDTQYIGDPVKLIEYSSTHNKGTSEEYDAWGSIFEFEPQGEVEYEMHLDEFAFYNKFPRDMGGVYVGDDLLVGDWSGSDIYHYQSQCEDRQDKRLATISASRKSSPYVINYMNNGDVTMATSGEISNVMPRVFENSLDLQNYYLMAIKENSIVVGYNVNLKQWRTIEIYPNITLMLSNDEPRWIVCDSISYNEIGSWEPSEPLVPLDYIYIGKR